MKRAKGIPLACRAAGGKQTLPGSPFSNQTHFSFIDRFPGCVCACVCAHVCGACVWGMRQLYTVLIADLQCPVGYWVSFVPAPKGRKEPIVLDKKPGIELPFLTVHDIVKAQIYFLTYYSHC